MFDMRESEFTTHVEPLVKFSRKFHMNPIEFVIETELSSTQKWWAPTGCRRTPKPNHCPTSAN